MVIYQNPRAWRVRIAQAALWVFGGLIVWGVPFSGAPVGSQAELIFVWVIWALTLATLAGTEFYLRAYVLSMRFEGTQARITTLTFFGQRSLLVDPSNFAFGSERNDRAYFPVSVNNYWMALKVPGEMLPLIVDTTSADVNMGALRAAANRKRTPPARGVNGKARRAGA